MDCPPHKPLPNGSQIILTYPAHAKVAVNIKPCQCAEYGLSNRGMLARKQLIPLWVGAAYLIVRNNILRRNTGECEQ